MVEAAFTRQDVDEAQFDPVDGDGARDALELGQTTELPEAAARLPLFL